jgi:hypothetical protein
MTASSLETIRVLAERKRFFLRELVQLLAAEYELPPVSVLQRLLHDLEAGLFDEGTPNGDEGAAHSDRLDSSHAIDGCSDHPYLPTGWTFHTTGMDGRPTEEPLSWDFRDIQDRLSDLMPEDIDQGGYRNISIERTALVRYFTMQTAWPIPDFLAVDDLTDFNYRLPGRPGWATKLSVSRAVRIFRQRDLVRKTGNLRWRAQDIVALFKRIAPAFEPLSDRRAKAVLKQLEVQKFGAGYHPTQAEIQSLKLLIEAESADSTG